MLLGEGEGTSGRQKVTEHAGKYTAIVTVALLGSVGCRLDELPLLLVGQRAALLGQMLVLQVPHQPLEVAIAAAGHGVVELDALLGHVDDGDGPVHAGDVDCGIEFAGGNIGRIGNVDLQGWVRSMAMAW